MKRFRIICLYLAALFCSMPLWVQAQTEPKLTTYTIDPMHSYVEWRISHFDFSYPTGKWYITGTLLLDEQHPQQSKVTVSIPVTDFVTGIPELDKHLKSKEFFNTAQFPTANFVSNKVTLTGKHTAIVEGQLTVHGVTKPVSLKVTLNKIGLNTMTKKESVGFGGSTTLKRSDFGMNAYLPVLGDEVNMTFEVEANQP